MSTLTPSVNNADLQYKIESINGEEVVTKRVVVHQFTIYDSTDDPDLWAAEPLYQWEHSEAGQWVMQHSLEKPVWHRQWAADLIMCYRYVVVARLTLRDQTFFKLKYQ